MLNTRVIDDFLSKEEIDVFLSYCKSTDNWIDGDSTELGKDFWSGRSIYLEAMPPEIANMVLKVKDRLSEAIEKEYGKKHYCDLIHLVRWPDGYEQALHSDDMMYQNHPEDYEWFHHRTLSSIIYLNDDFEGGHTYYDKFPEATVKPKPGRAAIHPGDVEHYHGVTKVVGNTRYTLPSFWGTDPQYELKFEPRA